MLIERVTDSKGRVLQQSQHRRWTRACAPSPARNAFVMDHAAAGDHAQRHRRACAGHAQAADLYGKTGTTNDSMDAWFAGFQPTMAAVVWIGYDNPKKLGDRETGGGLSLPVWIEYMAAGAPRRASARRLCHPTA